MTPRPSNTVIRWLRRSLWLGGFACLWLHVFDDPPLRTDPYVQDVSASGGVVAMITASAARLACELRDGAGVVVQRVEDRTARRRHALRFSGLNAGARYAYRVLNGDVVVGEGRLATAPADDGAPVRFAFLGDSGAQPWWVWLQRTPALHLPARRHWLPTAGAVTAIGRAVADYAPDFVLHLGDVVYPRGWNAHYSSGFFRPFGAALRDAPFFGVLGNHDVMDAQGVQWMANFVLPEGEMTGDSACYSFAWGPVRVIALDCDLRTGQVDREHIAARYLRGELERCTEPWIVVMSHFPMWSASRQRNRGDLLTVLEPMMRDFAVDLYVSGHDHCYQRFGPDAKSGIEVPMIVSGGGGKDLYEVVPDRKAKVLRSEFHWCSAEIAGPRLVVKAHAIDGALIDSLELSLPTAEALRGRPRVPSARAERIRLLRR